MSRIYMCVDLKSFYASVECRERGLDPLNTNLVVADSSRTEKTVCLAVTPTLKQYGLSGRSRLYQIIQKVREVNYQRKKENNYRKFTKKSYFDSELKNNKSLELDFIIAPPRMKYYMKYSTDIYNIYLKYLAPEDIFAYSIDEVFCDITNYLNYYKLSPKELASKIIKDIYNETGITATAGIGTNMYLAKVCMDIVAKHSNADEIGVRLSELDIKSYREKLWNHKPLTDFWRIGPGIAKKLEQNKLYTMGDVARCSLENENLLFKLFGVNAELIIDHAWGYEPVTIDDVKKYKPKNNSISTGQVLHCPYNYNDTKLIVREMIDLLSLDLTAKNIVTDQLVLDIGYDVSNLENNNYYGEITIDHYGRKIPKPSHGTVNISYKTDSSKVLSNKCIELYEKIIKKNLLVRRINITACNVISKEKVKKQIVREQLNLFSDSTNNNQEVYEKENQEQDSKLQHVLLNIKNKYGKNSILKGMNLEKKGTTKERNEQVGGHKG